MRALSIEATRVVDFVRPIGTSGVDILLVNVPQRSYTAQNPRLPNERVLPPLGLAYLATYLEHHGVRVAILDGEFAGASCEDIITAALAVDARSYGVNCYSPTASLTFTIANGLASTGSPVFIGGVHATYCATDVGRHCPSATVLQGYAEKSLLLHLSRSVRDSEIIGTIDPMSLWLRRSHLVADPHRKAGRPTSCLLSSRGCPYSCTFCTSANTSYVRRSIDDVVREMQRLAVDNDVSHFQFLDDLFLSTPRRSVEFAVAKQAANLDGVTWQGLATVKTLALHASQDALERVRNSGCVQLSVGFEAGTERIRRMAGKEYTRAEALLAIRKCHECGIKTKGFFMVGFPGETALEIQQTIDWIFELRANGLTDISLFQVKLYPGTRLRDIAVANTGAEAADQYYEYDLRSTTSHVVAMRAFSRESYGNRVQISDLSPAELEDVIQDTTARFYSN